MRGSKGALVLAVTLVALVAGCTGPVGPPVSSSTVPQDAPSEGGDGGYNLTLAILDEPGGPEIEGAAVVVYWGTYEGEASGSVDVSGSAEGGSGGGSADGVVRVSVQPATPEPSTTVPLRTDADGTVTARVPANQIVGIVASAPGYTEEWVPRAATGADGSSGRVSMPLYKASVTRTENGTWGPAGVSPGRVTGSNFAWEPREVPWGASPAARAGYVERLASLRMTLTWSNGPTGGGDLSIGAGDTSSEADFVQEQDNPQAAPGEHTEQAVLEKGRIDELGWPPAGTLYVGPASSTAYAAPMGLDYTLETRATFDPFAQPTGGRGNGNQAPGPGLLLLPLVAGAALVLGRRRS